MPPIPAAEQAQLLAFDQRLHAVLDCLEVCAAGFRPGRNGFRQLRSFPWISLERQGHIHPIQRMQVVEVDHVVLHVLVAPMMLRIRLAFSGTSMPSASSTARTEVKA